MPRVISQEFTYDQLRLIRTHKFADLDSLHVHFECGQLIAYRQYPFHDPPDSCRKAYIANAQCLGNFPNFLDIKSVKLARRVLGGQLVV